MTLSPCKSCFTDKTETFLELFGNSLVRVQTMEYVEKMAEVLLRYVYGRLQCNL